MFYFFLNNIKIIEKQKRIGNNYSTCTCTRDGARIVPKMLIEIINLDPICTEF